MKRFRKPKPVTEPPEFLAGVHDGVPIGLGYFAVAFSLGIAMHNLSITALQGAAMSATVYASAGQYAALTVIAAGGSYVEMMIMIFVANMRYALMSCAVSQRLDEHTSMFQRLIAGLCITDEIFGISIARRVYHPYYSFGAFIFAIPCWALGTVGGIIAGDILPARLVSALSVALFGMFLAVIVPPARENRIIMGLVLTSFVASLAFTYLPVLSELSAGMRTIILTIVIASAGAILFPINEESEEN